jgi:uncharacterized membrane protein
MARADLPLVPVIIVADQDIFKETVLILIIEEMVVLEEVADSVQNGRVHLEEISQVVRRSAKIRTAGRRISKVWKFTGAEGAMCALPTARDVGRMELIVTSHSNIADQEDETAGLQLLLLLSLLLPLSPLPLLMLLMLLVMMLLLLVIIFQVLFTQEEMNKLLSQAGSRLLLHCIETQAID